MLLDLMSILMNVNVNDIIISTLISEGRDFFCSNLKNVNRLQIQVQSVILIFFFETQATVEARKRSLGKRPLGTWDLGVVKAKHS